MKKVAHIWIAFQTRDKRYAGSNDPVRLTLSYPEINRTVKVILDGKKRRDEGNLYRLDGPFGIEGTDYELSRCTARLEMLGKDAWKPRHIYIWQRLMDEQKGTLDQMHPIGLAAGLKKTLSTDKEEGIKSLTIPSIIAGDTRTSIPRVILIFTNADTAYSGTRDNVGLYLSNRDTLYGKEYFRPPAKSNRAYMEIYPLKPPPVDLSGENLSFVQLDIHGDNKWLPGRFYLFGLTAKDASKAKAVPLVYLNSWQDAGLGWMSIDESEGKPVIKPPLYKDIPEPFPILRVQPITVIDRLSRHRPS
jgi:hypothetical protein